MLIYALLCSRTLTRNIPGQHFRLYTAVVKYDEMYIFIIKIVHTTDVFDLITIECTHSYKYCI